MKYLKYIPWLIVIAAVGFVAFSQYQKAQANAALLDAKNKQLMTANLELGRAQTTIVKQKDLHRTAIDDLDKKWKKEIKDRKALITQYAQLEGLYTAEQKKRKVITKVLWKERNTEHTVDLPFNKLFIRQDNGEYKHVESMTWAYKDFRLSIQGDAVKQTLSYKLHQKFRAQFVETKLPTGGRNHYAKFYEVDDQGKDVGELELTKFEVLKANELASKMFWWNPKVDLLAGGGINTRLQGFWTAEFGLSLMSHGQTPDDMRWRFLRLGLGVTNHGFALSFSPAQYNLGKHLPLVSNVWLTPLVGYDFGAGVPHLGLGIGVVF